MNKPIKTFNYLSAQMNEPKYIGTAEVAKILNISAATAKRYMDEGILGGYKTEGKHRRYLLSDVKRFRKQNQFPSTPILFTDHSPATNGNLDQASADLYQMLLNGEDHLARELVNRFFEQEIPMETLADKMIGPAMTAIGKDWEDNKIDVFQEHQATRLCESMLIELQTRFGNSLHPDRPVAIGGSPESDPTVIGNLLIQMVLQDVGWKTVNLGPHTPLNSFRKALRHYQPKLLWISMTHPIPEPEEFLHQYQLLYSEAKDSGTAVAIGGQGLSEEVRNRMKFSFFGDGMVHLAEFADNLVPLPKRPKRGRPPVMMDSI